MPVVRKRCVRVLVPTPPGQIPSRCDGVAAFQLNGAQNDKATGFEEPVRVYEVRWRDES